MFSPPAKRSNLNSRREPNLGHTFTAPDSPVTPFQHNRLSDTLDDPIPNRPSTGTPAPWAPRLSVLARISPSNTIDEENDIDPIKPVFVTEIPREIRDEQTSFLGKRIPGASVCGGMDKRTCYCWLICGNKVFLWSYLTRLGGKDYTVLEIPSSVVDYAKNWLLSVVSWGHPTPSRGTENATSYSRPAGVVMCNRKTRVVIYWPDIFPTAETSVKVIASLEVTSLFTKQPSILDSSKVGSNFFNSLITADISHEQRTCVALACSFSGEIWQFHCSPDSIQYKIVHRDTRSLSSDSKGYPRSLIWRFLDLPKQDSARQFFVLTDCEIQCFSVNMYPDLSVSKSWSHEIVGNNADSGIKKDLASQKQIWPLDLQVDDKGKVITILVASVCMDRASGSSYTQFSLLTMQYKSEIDMSGNAPEDVLEKKAPIQVVIPKARVENEDFLFSMRLKVGGMPSGSAIILSGDGTATVSHCFGNSTKLYQFDLPFDGGKVLDASVLPSADDDADSAWVVLTEKAGIWAIPKQAVVLGGVEPPERSLSRKGSSNGRSPVEQIKNLRLSGNIAHRSDNSDALDTRDRQTATKSGMPRRTGQDEESEALLIHLFDVFVTSGIVDNSLEKFLKSGAFDRDGETNIFTRKSKSIVDTLAKHWTTTRGAEIVASTVISTQLIEKQQKHQKFLQFLALSKCHEELCSRQRKSLQTVLEHGEKLAGMIALRDLQSLIKQNRSDGAGQSRFSAESHVSGALWDLIQLVGERARRNTVLLMDRDNAEVFYSKVSDLEEVFYCLDKQLEYVVSTEQPLPIQTQRACELSNACAKILQTAMLYRNQHQMWYPPPEGITPWYCQPVVRNGLWRITSFMLQLLSEASGLMSTRSDISTHLEVLAEVLLEAYSGAITAKVERKEEHRSLLNEYWNKRDTLLDTLYQQVKSFVEAGYKGPNEGFAEQNEGFEEQNVEILRKRSLNLLSIAKRHESYKILWTICYDLNDSVLVKNLMHDSMGPQGGFSYYVFEQLYVKKQFAELLRLGEEFQEELMIFLKRHRDLLWLHELFLHQFSAAAENLHDIALSQDEGSVSTDEDGADPKLALADRRRLLNLSKIGAMAGKDADFESKVKRIEADLKLLKLQESISRVFPDNEAIGQQLLRPEELIDICLNSNDWQLVLHTFDVFAWTSSSFRKSHRPLLEECWKKAADLDDWDKLYQASTTEGWSEEETLQQLSGTALFHASNRCYRPQAESIDGKFDEVLPLQEVSGEISMLQNSRSCVEAILMQHKDFPEAGKLMLTAIMLGSVNEGVEVEVEASPSPME